MSSVREPKWAGQFYPANSEALRSKIESFLQNSTKTYAGEKIYGVIVPHAGYDYSGRIAAMAFNLLKERTVETAVILAPSHSQMISGASLYSGDFYQTPLGSIAVNKELGDRLVEASSAIVYSQKGHNNGLRPEHSLEVQLPFLQSVLKNEFRILPLVVQDYSQENCREIGRAISKTIDPNTTIMVASSDLYHGYAYKECKRRDQATLNSIQSFDPDEFINGANQEIYQACGAGPIAILLYAARELGANDIELLEQSNSSDITGMRGDWTVGYASLVVGRK